MSRISKSMETESRLVVARGCGGGRGRLGNDCFNGYRFPFGMMKSSGTRYRWWLHNIMNVTELYTLKLLLLF